MIFGVSALWFVVATLALGALASSLHLALVDLARAVLEDLATVRNRPRATARVGRILTDLPGHARAAAAFRTVLDAGAAVSMTAWVAHLGGRELFAIGGGDGGGGGVAGGAAGGTAGSATVWDAAVGVAVAGLAVWVLGVALPSSVAWHVGERLVYACSLPLRAAYWATAPLRPAARFVDEVVRRLAGIDATTRNEELGAELMSVVEEGEREGQLDESERDMIEAVVEFRNLTVEQVMTPRTEIEAFELTDDLGAVTRIVRDIGHSRIPVYQGDLDHVVGIFYVKDLMRWLAGEGTAGAPRGPSGPFDLRSILRPAAFVPETKTARELLKELLSKKVHIALVADEYGGTSGLVTIEDLVEEIVGDIRDEYEPEEGASPQWELKPEDGTAEIDARAYIDDVNPALERLGYALPEGDEYDTVGGFVITTLGRIPAEGEQFRHERALVTVLEASPTRVVRVRLEVGREGEREQRSERPEATGQGPEPAGSGSA